MRTDPLAKTYEEHARRLWAVCYRMTGSGADADEIVQETFARAIEHAPDTSRSLAPWLFRVAMNLARDRLRRRKARGYDGPWLPEPIETPASEDAPLFSPAARYAEKESVTFAFLLALEALDPRQRAVLLLRDYCDYSVRETAHLLEMSEGNVKVVHHRARAAMARYDAERRPVDAARIAAVQEALLRFVAAVSMGDVDAMVRALAEDVVMTNDANGEFSAARRVVRGAQRVALFQVKVAEPGIPSVRPTLLNHLPGLVAQRGPEPRKPPPRGRGERKPVARRFALVADGSPRLSALHLVLATPKLARLAFPPAPG